MRILPLSIIPAFIHLFIAPASAQGFPSPHEIASSLSGFVDSVKDAIVPPQKFKSFDEEAQKPDPQVGYIILDEIARVYEGAVQSVIDLKGAAEQVIQHSKKTITELEEIIGKGNVNIAELARRFEERIGELDLGPREEADSQLPECDLDARAQLVAQVLDKVQPIYLAVLTEVGVPPEKAEEQYNGFATMIKTIFLIISELICKHPILMEIVIFVVSTLLISQIPIFRGILRLLGFGLRGPVRGSLAAWLQSRLWGGAVARGSWFAILQRAGMKLTGSWFEKLVTSAGFAAFFGFAKGHGQDL